MGSETEEARRRYRNTVFDREAKAAASLLEQVRQYVGRSGKCQVTDFEDLCTIHHAISNLFDRVKRFSTLESMPRVYRNAVKEAGIERPSEEAQDDAQVLILQGAKDLEDPESETAIDLTPSAPLFDLVRKVPEVSMEDLCRNVAIPQQIPAPSPRSPAAPRPPPRRRKVATAAKAAPAQRSPTSRPNSSAKGSKPSGDKAVPTELFVEVFMEFTNGSEPPEGQVLQEMRLEMQVVELPSRTPLRSLRVTNVPGSIGTAMLEVTSFPRAELCMALIKESGDEAAPKLSWDDSEEFSMLSPDGGSRSASVSSALRVPVSQLLSACAVGATLEWEADGARTIVVSGRLLRAGKAVEFVPGSLEAVPTPGAARPPWQPKSSPAGSGATAASALKDPDADAKESAEAEADLISRYVSRLLARGSNQQTQRSEQRKRPMSPLGGGLVRGL